MDSTSIDSDAYKCDELSDGNPQVEHSIERGASKVLQRQSTRQLSPAQIVGDDSKQSELLRKAESPLHLDNISPELSPTYTLRDESKQSKTLRERLESFPHLQSFGQDLPSPVAPAEVSHALSKYGSLIDRITSQPYRKRPKKKERQNAFVISNAVQTGVFKALEGWDGMFT